MTAALLDHQPELGTKWASMNPLGRLGRPEELRGVIAWLASDVSPHNGRPAAKTMLILGFIHRPALSARAASEKF